MSAAPIHNKIITQVGREILRPLGVKQKGRSRLWIDDHGWWIINIEFQPSSWSRGSYLNVGAQWLWHRSPAHSFEYGERVMWPSKTKPTGFVQYIEYESDEQFLHESRKLAERAAERVKQIRDDLSDIEILPQRVIEKRHLKNRYPAYHAGIAYALLGRIGDARTYLEQAIIDEPEHEWNFRWNEQVLSATALLDDSVALRAYLVDVITEQRATLRLPALRVDLPSQRTISKAEVN